MNKAKQLTIILSALMLVFLTGITSANTLVAGKIYDNNYNNFISGADIIVTCNNNPLSTASIDDGTYAVVFESCTEGDSIHVSASKGSLTGEGDGIIIQNEDQTESDYISIVNLIIKQPAQTNNGNSGGSGGSNKYYKCGNNICDTGETIKTCPKDCNLDLEKLSTGNEITNTSNEKIDLTGLKGQEEKNPEINGSFSSIWNAKTIIGLVIAIIIIILGIAISSYKNKEIQEDVSVEDNSISEADF